MIPDKILSSYHMTTLADYKLIFGNFDETIITFYKTFLIQTDYVAAKLAEAAYLGQTPNEDYTEVLAARQEAREEINRLQTEFQQGEEAEAETQGGGNDGQET